jgi:hypothetical protein
MEMKKVLFSIAALGALTALQAHATPIRLDGPEMDLQQIAPAIDVINGQYALDEAWVTSSAFGSDARIVMELAGYAGQNRLGIYDIYDTSKRFELFSGAASAGASTSFEVGPDGTLYGSGVPAGLTFASNLFGFYLQTPVGLWFSQSDLNADSADHLVAYQSGGVYLLGWEDLSSQNWDQDYNDFVVRVSGVDGVAVPEPASLGLLGFGLAGIGMFRRRKKAANA